MSSLPDYDVRPKIAILLKKDKELKSQIIQGCKSAKLRRRALQDNLNLTNLLLAARQMELANEQAGKMEKETFEETNSVQTKFKHQSQSKRKSDKKKE